MNTYFVTSPGTDIGKTFVTTALCWHSKRIGRSVQAIKPVVSGWDSTEGSDTAKIINSLGLDITEENIKKISPWRFKYSRSPNVAAKMSATLLEYDDILEHCSKACKKSYDYTFIEGVGGVMSPITDNKSSLDVIRDLKLEVILVIGAYLGGISHALTALEVLRDSKVRVILSLKDQDNEYYEDVVRSIRMFSGHEVYVQKYVEHRSHTPWIHTAPEIIHFITGSAQGNLRQ